MRLKRLRHKPYGLRARLGLTLLLSGLICGGVFCGLFFSMEALLTDHFARSDLREYHIQKQGQNLQRYIDEKGISSKDLYLLRRWEHRQPVILLEIYSGADCIYSSFYKPSAIRGNPVRYDLDLGERDNAVPIRLKDREVTAVLYSDYTYQYYVLGTAVCFALSLLLFVALFLWSSRRLISYICLLNEEVQVLEGGELEHPLSVQGNDELTDLARSMDGLRLSFREQLEREQRLHQASRRLVSEMSHDMRTPLTGILLYLEILRSGRYETKTQLRDYLEKIDAKAHHLKLLSDHLFEYALESAPARRPEPRSAEQAFGRAAALFRDDLAARGFRLAEEVAWEPCFVQVPQEELSRIFENILSNIVKYADPAKEVRLATLSTEKYFGFSVLNACAASPAAGESSGIGIESVRGLMSRLGGICTVEQTEEVFEITLLFPKQ